jgi:hypothetical protein
MKEIDDILKHISHRGWKLPNGKWSYYQEWNNALFLHWRIDISELQKLTPSNLVIDKFEGESWISIVAFTMEKIRPRYLPAISVISNFDEINVRTYLTHENKPGVFFLNIEAQKLTSTFIAKLLSGLPYEKSEIERGEIGNTKYFKSCNKNKNFKLDVKFVVGQELTNKSTLDKWLTERYCLYLKSKNETYRYEIQHKPWKLFQAETIALTTNYTFGNITLNRKPDLIHYSKGVKVLAWDKEKITDIGTIR